MSIWRGAIPGSNVAGVIVDIGTRDVRLVQDAFTICVRLASASEVDYKDFAI